LPSSRLAEKKSRERTSRLLRRGRPTQKRAARPHTL